jgi:hypothetical protein
MVLFDYTLGRLEGPQVHTTSKFEHTFDIEYVMVVAKGVGLGKIEMS